MATATLEKIKTNLIIHPLSHRVMGDDEELKEMWTKWNEIFFSSSLSPTLVTYENTDYGKWLGQFHLNTGRITIRKYGHNTNSSQCAHHLLACRRHEAFKGLTDFKYGIALVVLHEMMHQAVHENGGNNKHYSQDWADWCNLIAMELDIGLTYAGLKRGKTKTIEGSRKNIWKPIDKTFQLRENTRMATFQEMYTFPSGPRLSLEVS